MTAAQKLRWSPPTLTAPVTRNLSGTTNVANGSGGDMIVNITSAVTECVIIENAHNVQLIGGQINVTNAALTIDEKKGITVKDCLGGIVHIEGVHMTGSQLAEGIQYGAGCTDDTIYQLQACRVERARALDLVDPVAGNHADCLQALGSGECRVDRYTGYTDYQGTYVGGPAPAVAVGSQRWSRVDLHAIVHADGAHPNTMLDLDARARAAWAYDQLDDVWIEFLSPAVTGYDIEEMVYPYGGTRSSSRTGWSSAWRPSLDEAGRIVFPKMLTRSPILGRVNVGARPGGNFVTAAEVGMSYVSPGYL